MSSSKRQLTEMVYRWQEEAEQDPTDHFKYSDALKDILYHGEMRFSDYEQYRLVDGPFPLRLLHWLNNCNDERDRRCLFQLLHWILFIDNRQMKALYRDAYRRIISPWVTREFHIADLLSSEFEILALRELKKYHLRSLTESFNVSLFKQVGNIQGLPKLQVLGENQTGIRDNIRRAGDIRGKLGLVLLEDFVGTGNQACTILNTISDTIPEEWHCLFVPLLIQQSGINYLNQNISNRMRLTIEPVLIIADNCCVKSTHTTGEPERFQYFRSLVTRTAAKVLENYRDDLDDTPRDPFGYEGSGALVVTSHNAPNNSLPLIHRRSDDWRPLFRRIHHGKD